MIVSESPRLLLPLAVAATALVARAPRAAAQERPPRVGVVVELAVSVEPDRADAIGAALADALDRELRVDAFGGADVARLLPAGGLPEECLAQPACVADVAHRLDAEQLLFLVIVQVGVDVQVDASWVDVARGAVTARPRVILPSDASAVSVFATQATRYLPDAPRRRGDTIVVTTPGGGGAGGLPLETRARTPRRMTTTSWITAGVAGVSLGASVVLGAGVRSTYKRCEREVCDDDELDGLAHRALAADLCLGAGLAAAVATGVLYWRSGGEERAVTVTPTGGGALLGVRGAW